MGQAKKMFKQWRVKRVGTTVMKECRWAMGSWKAAVCELDERAVRFVRNFGLKEFARDAHHHYVIKRGFSAWEADESRVKN